MIRLPTAQQSLAAAQSANRRLAPDYEKVQTDLLDKAERELADLLRTNSDRGICELVYSIPTVLRPFEETVRREVKEMLIISLRKIGYVVELVGYMTIRLHWDLVSVKSKEGLVYET